MLFHRFGLASECFGNLSAAATNYEAAVRLVPANVSFQFSFVGIILQFSSEELVSKNNRSTALTLWYNSRAPLRKLIPNRFPKNLTVFDDAIKLITEWISRYALHLLINYLMKRKLYDFKARK